MAPRYVRLRVPRMPAGLAANLLGLAGLIGVAVTVGALTGTWWWSVGVGSVFAVGLSWLASAELPSIDEPAGASNVHPIASPGVRAA